MRVRAPGRVNLIGEHTDYNDGLCLPFAIEQGITVTAEPLDAPRIEVTAADLGERDTFALDAGIEPAAGWRAFVRGVAAELRADGHAVAGARLRIEGDLPRGAGLASSAALAVGVALALAGAEGRDPIALAKLCSRVENDWVGARTGLLDQLAVLLAEPGAALKLDFRALDATTTVPLDLGDWRLALLDSGAQHAHAHATGGYNARRAECAAAAGRLGIASLRDATLEAAARLPDPLSRRVRHVITENARVEATEAALARRDLAAVGAHLDASHASLRDDYDASVPAVEETVARARAAGAAGARMVGGGFGGAVLALFPPDAPPPPGSAEVRPGPGARRI